MNWTDDPKKVSEWLCLLMGKCPKPEYIAGDDHCTICGELRQNHQKFNAFTPDGIWQWKDFMMKEMPNIWGDYVDWIWDYNPKTRSMPISKRVEAVYDPSNFTQWMADNMELWGYVKRNCPHCFIGGVQRHITHPCEKCGATGGKIINPKYQKAVEWIEKEEV